MNGVGDDSMHVVVSAGLAFDPWIVINKQSARYSDFWCRCERRCNTTQALQEDGVGWHIAESSP